MLKLIVIAVSTVLIGGVIYWDNKTLPQDMGSSVYAIDKDDQAYEQLSHFPFQTLEGKSYSTQDLKHETLLIHFWAGWCTSCFAEFPVLLEYVKRQKGKVALLSISIDQKQESYERFMKRLEKEMEQREDLLLRQPYDSIPEGSMDSDDMTEDEEVPVRVVDLIKRFSPLQKV